MAERQARSKHALMATTTLSAGVHQHTRAGLKLAGLLGVLAVAAPHGAKAFNLYDGTLAGNGLEINLSTTISYTGIFRASNPSDRLTSPVTNANGSEGDLNFQHGLVSNEIEILPILDIKDGNYGAHLSGEAYLNTVYLQKNQNDQPGTYNPISTGSNRDFTSATRNVEGQNARLLDAFIYGTQHFGPNDSQTATLKFGRQTLLWGQSLFLANNGIAAGMAPFDVITSDQLPNAQTQQKILPVGQAVLTYQPNDTLTFQGYYQFEWEPDNLEGVGAYFSSTDILDKGGQRLFLAPGFGVPRTKNVTPPIQNGQFGASVQATLGNYDVGLFGLRYDSKAPAVYLATPFAQSYSLVYPRDIWIEAASLSTTVGPANVAGEVSMRQHMNLTTGANFSGTGNVNSDPAYPVGDTLAAQVSAIYLSGPIPFDPGGISVDGEIGFNHVLKVTANDAAISSVKTGGLNRSATAADAAGTLTFQYSNVLPNLQLDFPIGINYNFYGRSRIDSTENAGTGSANIGVTATYRVVWNASVTYNQYFGAANPLLQGEPSVADRSYVLLNLSYSF